MPSLPFAALAAALGRLVPRRRTGSLAAAIGLVAAQLVLTPPAAAQRQQVEPETADRIEAKPLAVGQDFMVATANPHASEAARAMLKAGGSAVDAAIAAQLVLGLVEPQSSGLGGGAFLLNWDQSKNELTSIDGRETAPAAANPDRFLDNGQPITFDTAVHSGLSIGTPGLVRLLAHAHKKHGRLPWGELFEPAIRLAKDGFAVSRRLAVLIAANASAAFAADARRYFLDEAGKPLSAGHLLKNPAYAATLEAIAARGADAFYAGPVAEAIVAAARAAPNRAGDLSLDDLARYRIEERLPVCVGYRAYRICGMGPPSSGGIAIAQVMKLLESFDLGKGTGAAGNVRAMHLVAEAEKLAYADRSRYVADPAFVAVPEGLLDDTYLAGRRRLMDAGAAMPPPPAGEPPATSKRAFGNDATLERAGTSHLSIVDGDGNAVALTTTIEGAFGSGVMAAGFLLNNQLTDFSLKPTAADGTPIANRVEAGKRPRSTMAPTIVFDDKGAVVAVLGSPGGGRIILYVVKALVALLDWQLDAQAAAAFTNFGSMGGALEIESSMSSLIPALRLKTYGHDIDLDDMNSGLSIVARRNGRLEGGVDPRREGVALGD